MTEIYAYYQFLIDLHIAQVRPENRDMVSYINPAFNQINTQTSHLQDITIDNKFFEYYHRWREPTRTWRSQTQEIDHERERAEAPKNHHPDAKGSIYDVEITEDQKFPHVANRLGYPEFATEPIEAILGLERAPAHPGYQIQAFVQTPSMDPDPLLSFELGETIYENTRVGEWIRLWKISLGALLISWPASNIFEIYAGDGAPSLQWLYDAGFWHTPPLQFNDAGGWNLEKVRYCDDNDYMNMQYGVKRGMARPMHTFY